jgi:hypothetical protein
MMREEPVSEPKPNGKPFEISKRLVWEAWLKVKANKGAAGAGRDVRRLTRLRAAGSGAGRRTG